MQEYLVEVSLKLVKSWLTCYIQSLWERCPRIEALWRLHAAAWFLSLYIAKCCHSQNLFTYNIWFIVLPYIRNTSIKHTRDFISHLSSIYLLITTQYSCIHYPIPTTKYILIPIANTHLPIDSLLSHEITSPYMQEMIVYLSTTPYPTCVMRWLIVGHSTPDVAGLIAAISSDIQCSVT